MLTTMQFEVRLRLMLSRLERFLHVLLSLHPLLQMKSNGVVVSYRHNRKKLGVLKSVILHDMYCVRSVMKRCKIKRLILNDKQWQTEAKGIDNGIWQVMVEGETYELRA